MSKIQHNTLETNLNQPHCRCTVVLACTHSKYIYISMFVLNVPKKKRERNCVFCVPTALLSFQRPCLSERQETVVVLQILVFAYYFGTHRWQLPGMYSHNLSGSWDGGVWLRILGLSMFVLSLCYIYSLENWHGTYKSPLWKGTYSSKPSDFWIPWLVFSSVALLWMSQVVS